MTPTVVRFKGRDLTLAAFLYFGPDVVHPPGAWVVLPVPQVPGCKPIYGTTEERALFNAVDFYRRKNRRWERRQNRKSKEARS